VGSAAFKLNKYTDEQTKTAEPELHEEKLRALFSLQLVDSEVDKIRTLRGELPLEVQDLEDEVEGLETRINNLKSEIAELEKSIVSKTNEITVSQGLIKKYEDQQNNVRNNRI
jgi:predicted  nucleic acid-binding Zn-ribbon protein